MRGIRCVVLAAVCAAFGGAQSKPAQLVSRSVIHHAQGGAAYLKTLAGHVKPSNRFAIPASAGILATN